MSVKLDYGVPTNRSGLNVRFGVDKGFFADEGIDLNVRVVYGGPEISAAYDSGELKIGELGTPPGVTAIGNGKRFKIVGSGLQRGIGLFFLVRPEITDWNGLKGKTLGALSIGSCSYWYLVELLKQHGIDPVRDVSIRGLNDDYPRQIELFEKERSRACCLRSPMPHWGKPNKCSNRGAMFSRSATCRDCSGSFRLQIGIFWRRSRRSFGGCCGPRNAPHAILASIATNSSLTQRLFTAFRRT